MLNSEEISHYSRHLKLDGFGKVAQLKLKAANVLVIGAGGLGCPVLQYLTAAGVGNIGITDGDIVEKSNLQRQVLFSCDDIGKNKATSAAKKLELHNPHISLKAISEFVSKDNALDLINKYDVIVDCSDNFGTRYLVNDACVICNKPLIFGSLFKFEGQVSVFNYRGGPTYRCLFPEPPKPEDAPNCSQIGILGVLPGIIGSLQALECIKIITQIGESLSGRLLIYNGLKQSFQEISYKRAKRSDINSLSSYETPCNIKFNLSISEVKQLLSESSKIQFVDVREKAEYDKHNIGALNLPLSEPEKLLSVLKKNIPVIVHCQSGKRSLKAMDILKNNNFRKVYNMSGGILDWN